MHEDAPTERVKVDATTRGSGFASGQRLFARYTLEAQVGRGGMGVVWRARDEKLDRSVALKFLPPEVAADAEAVRDLKRETTRCLDLTHVNIVRVYDFLEEGPVAAIAMEYVEGESLARIKANSPGGCLSVTDLAPLVTQLCGALDYAHRVARVAHHDLKPANVLVTSTGVLKVTDFGIARSLTETHTRLSHQQGTTSGTVLYMSPQQLAGEKPTAADDIYGLGAMLYELLTGKPPFFRGDSVSLRQQVIERTPAALPAHRADVGCVGAEIPERWSTTILACLAKKPEQRPASAADVALKLGLTLDPIAATSSRSSFLGRPANVETPKARSFVPALVVIGVMLVAATAAGIHYGIYLPERKRAAEEAERAHKAEIALQAEQARMAEEKRRQEQEEQRLAEVQAVEDRKREDEARVKMANDQAAYAAIMEKLTAAGDSPANLQSTDLQRAVRQYLRNAPDDYRALVEKAWADRQAAWRAAAAASRPGTLFIETDPPGASVTLYPRNERKTSPAIFDSVKPGDVTVRIEKEGYDPKDIPFVVKPGAANKLAAPVKLVAAYGTLQITSDPADIAVIVDGAAGRRLEGRTPLNPPPLPPGEYKITYQKQGWRPVVKTALVERGKNTAVTQDLQPRVLEIRSTPAGAEISIDGHPLGPAPRKGTAQPGEYVITASLEGYEPYTKTILVTKDMIVPVVLTEKPLPHALRRIAGAKWSYDSFTLSAELAFTVTGRIEGNHKIALSGQVHDVGAATTYNDKTKIIHARFTANGPNKPYYTGNVQIELVDDDHIAVSWTAAGSNERVVFQREKPKTN